MRAAFIHAPFDARIGDLPLPNPSADEILIDIAAVGICGSDLHYYKEGKIGAAQTISEPFVPGHEFAAYLREPLPEKGLDAGSLVAVDPARPCNVCEWCSRGEVNLCPNVYFTGSPPSAHGALTKSVLTTPSQIFAVPENFDPELVALLEPLGVCIHAIDLAKPQWFESVVILGCGPIGLGILQLVCLAGVDRVFAIDAVGHRREKARRLGAKEVSADIEAIGEWTNNRGADLVIEATNSPDGLSHAATSARIGGRCVIVGIADGNEYRIDAATPRRKQLQIIFSRRMGHVYPRAIRLVAEQRIDIRTWVSHRIGLSAVPAAFAQLANYQDEVVKVIVDPRME